MEENYTIGLAIFDFVPTLAFLAGGYYLVRLALLTRGKACSLIMASGTILVFLGGILKATWKLLITMQIADIQAFSDALFIFQAPGFLLMLVAMIMITQSKTVKNTLIPVIVLWKIPLLVVMTIGSLGTLGAGSYLSFRRGVRIAGWCYVITIILTLVMSGMAQGSEQSIHNQWVEESINSLSQISFAFGSVLLYRNFKK